MSQQTGAKIVSRRPRQTKTEGVKVTSNSGSRNADLQTGVKIHDKRGT